MILVIGSTGVTGMEAVRRLTERGEAVRALTRDPEKAAGLPGFERAEIVTGDSTRPEELAAAFEGVESVYLVPPTSRQWDREQRGLIEQAQRAGVRHMVKLSAIGAGPDQPSMSLRFHWQGEQEIEASGMAFTHIRPNSFAQNTLFDAATITGEDRFYSCVGDARFTKIDSRDIGAVVATVLCEPGHEGQVYEITGPEPLTYDDIAARLSDGLGRRIEYVDMGPDEYAEALVGAGFEDWMAREFADIYGRGFYRESRGDYVTGTVESLLGRPPLPYSEFVRDYADAFGRPA